MARKGTNEFEHMSTETSQTKQQREKWKKKIEEQNVLECGTITKVLPYV